MLCTNLQNSTLTAPWKACHTKVNSHQRPHSGEIAKINSKLPQPGKWAPSSDEKMTAITVCGKRSKMNRIKQLHYRSYCAWKSPFVRRFCFFLCLQNDQHYTANEQKLLPHRHSKGWRQSKIGEGNRIDVTPNEVLEVVFCLFKACFVEYGIILVCMASPLLNLFQSHWRENKRLTQYLEMVYVHNPVSIISF